MLAAARGLVEFLLRNAQPFHTLLSFQEAGCCWQFFFGLPCAFTGNTRSTRYVAVMPLSTCRPQRTTGSLVVCKRCDLCGCRYPTAAGSCFGYCLLVSLGSSVFACATCYQICNYSTKQTLRVAIYGANPALS